MALTANLKIRKEQGGGKIMRRNFRIGSMLAMASVILCLTLSSCTENNQSPNTGMKQPEWISDADIDRIQPDILIDLDESAYNPGLLVILEISREHYEVRNIYENVPFAYHVEAKITNKSGHEIKFSQVIGNFIPPVGKGKAFAIYPYTLRDDGTRARADEKFPFILQSGQTETYTFSTDGYTLELMNYPGDKPLSFTMQILLGETFIYVTPPIQLPGLGELNIYEATQVRKDLRPRIIIITP